MALTMEDELSMLKSDAVTLKKELESVQAQYRKLCVHIDKCQQRNTVLVQKLGFARGFIFGCLNLNLFMERIPDRISDNILRELDCEF
jgi:hypothetical protein